MCTSDGAANGDPPHPSLSLSCLPSLPSPSLLASSLSAFSVPKPSVMGEFDKNVGEGCSQVRWNHSASPSFSPPVRLSVCHLKGCPLLLVPVSRQAGEEDCILQGNPLRLREEKSTEISHVHVLKFYLGLLGEARGGRTSQGQPSPVHIPWSPVALLELRFLQLQLSWGC